ncbi:MAG: anthranilate phosphoribosyltransferase [Lachnospiraceae bacterium]|jgi:anthranilate synthase/phosphoribosyltransferase|nr:anthranilate phosphoribosyltransferase [Lachnospiraceae bacterium]
MILLIDNYDSFVYNVFQLTGKIIKKAKNDCDITVVRNDEITLEEIEKLAPTHIILSPGPGRPENAGICVEIVKQFGQRIPILGICLGHQAICLAYGAQITYAPSIKHGKVSNCYLDVGSTLFRNMEKRILAARYHSLCADQNSLPEDLRVTARAEAGEVMAVEHQKYPVYGLQFHPESVLTKDGERILENFLFPEQMSKEPEREVIVEAIRTLSEGQDIGYHTAKAVMNEIMSGKSSEIKKSAYLTLLSRKGETIDEITASAQAMRDHCVRIKPDVEVLEIVGTGADLSNSFNISTTASIIIASCGVPVAKHGNRAASSKSGAADCLEALGVNIMLEPQQNQRLLSEIGICFLFAQRYHTAMKYVAGVRKELGIRTIFNILGPLANPASASLQIMGVYEEALLLPMAKVLSNLGVKRGLVVYGQDRLDEISVCAPTSICEFDHGEYRQYVITPEEFGLQRYAPGALMGGTPLQNAEITRAILNGEQGAKRDAAILNAAAALYIARKVPGIIEGVAMAQEAIRDKRAIRLLDTFITCSNQPSIQSKAIG